MDTPYNLFYDSTRPSEGGEGPDSRDRMVDLEDDPEEEEDEEAEDEIDYSDSEKGPRFNAVDSDSVERGSDPKKYADKTKYFDAKHNS